MEHRIGDVVVHVEARGAGRPVLVLHGAGVDHREAAACFDPALRAHGGLRRLYPDLPGAGRTPAPARLASADDVLDVLAGLVDVVAPAGTPPVLLAGHSAGAAYAQALTTRLPGRVAGLALVCPLLPGVRDVPPHRPVVADEHLGDAAFRDYLVVQTPAMLDRYRRSVQPGIDLADEAAAARIGAGWPPTLADGPAFDGRVLVVAGRQDATVGYAAAVDLLERYPHATLAVLDGAGHALPHEQPAVLGALLGAWCAAALTTR